MKRTSPSVVECLVIFDNHTSPLIAPNISAFLGIITQLPDYSLIVPPIVSSEYVAFPTKLRVHQYVWPEDVEGTMRSEDPSDDEDVSVHVSSRK